MAGDVHAEPRLDRELAERAGWTIGIAALWAAGYFALGAAARVRVSHTLATPLDDAIPFVSWSVWIYLLGLAFIVIPAFARIGQGLFRRTAAAYCAVLLASFACFAVYPVSSLGLRPALPSSVTAGVTGWALEQLFEIDPHYNLFPSLHVSLSCVAAFSLSRASWALGTPAMLAATLICVAVCTVKQHFVLDVAGGVILGSIVGGLVLRPSNPGSDLVADR